MSLITFIKDGYANLADGFLNSFSRVDREITSLLANKNARLVSVGQIILSRITTSIIQTALTSFQRSGSVLGSYIRAWHPASHQSSLAGLPLLRPSIHKYSP